MTQLFPGLKGAAAFRSSISRPDSDGDMLRYRGVSIEDLVGNYQFDEIWDLLVTGKLGDGLLSDVGPEELPPVDQSVEDPRVNLQMMVSSLGPRWALSPLSSERPEDACDDLRRITVATSVRVGQMLRQELFLGDGVVSDAVVRQGRTVAERLILAWLGEVDEKRVRVLDGFLSTVAEHGTTASTFTARVVASTRADASACIVAALSAIGGPRHGGAARDVVGVYNRLATGADARSVVEGILERGGRLPGVGHRVYRIRDPRVATLKELARKLDAPLRAAAESYEEAVREALSKRMPNRPPLPVNIDAWMPVILDALGIPGHFVDSVLSAARIAGWCAHIYEEVVQNGPLLRPDDLPVGSAAT